MKIAITGSNGYIGKNLNAHLRSNGHEVLSVPRQMLYGRPEELADLIKNCNAIVNLAGTPIFKRWTPNNKTIIYNSRIVTTKNICAAINQLKNEERPGVFVGASAIGIYQPLAKHDEGSSNFATNFAGRVVMDWEDASLDLNQTVRRVIFRIAPVLGKDSAVIKKLLSVYKLGLGGKIATGKQPFPFIHVEDVIRAITQALEKDIFSGVFNLTAPEVINDETFSKKLAHAVNRSAFFSVPASLLQFAYGEAAEMITEAPEVIPKRLITLGFQFNYPDIDSALIEITT